MIEAASKRGRSRNMPTLKEIFFILGIVYFARELWAPAAAFNWWVLVVWLIWVAVWGGYHIVRGKRAGNQPAQ